MRIIEFMFTDFWHFIGCSLLISGIGKFILDMFRIIFKKK